MATTVDTLVTKTVLDTSGFAAGAQQAQGIIAQLGASIKSTVVSYGAPLLGAFAGAKALSAFADFKGKDDNGFETRAAGAKEYTEAIKAAKEAVEHLGAVVGQALAPGATAAANAFASITGIIENVVVKTIDFWTTAKKVIVDMVTSWTGGFSTISAGWSLAVNLIGAGINFASGLVTNWKILAETAFVSAELAVVRFANQTVYFFKDVIPSTITWLGDNIKDVLFTAFDYVTTLIINSGKNIRDFFSAVIAAAKNPFGGFKFNATPLLEGARSVLKTLPQIADREMGPLEKSLQDRLNGLAAGVVDKMKPFIGSTGGLGAGLSAFVKSIGDFFTKPKEGGNLVTELAGPSNKSVGAFQFGSKEAYSAIVAATSGATDKQLAEAKRHTSLLQSIRDNVGSKPKKAKI